MKCTDDVPVSIQGRLNSAFKGFVIQYPEVMNSGAVERWRSENPNQCPGLVSGSLEGKNARFYAVLLVPTDQAACGYRLIVFRPTDQSEVFDERMLEQSDGGDGRDFFIKAVPIERIFDKASRTRFDITGAEAVLLFDVGEQEYEIDAYYWTKAGYKHSPIDK